MIVGRPLPKKAIIPFVDNTSHYTLINDPAFLSEFPCDPDSDFVVMTMWTAPA